MPPELVPTLCVGMQRQDALRPVIPAGVTGRRASRCDIPTQGVGTRGQAAPDGANICYGILSCYKQAAPTDLMGNTFFKRLN